MKHNCSHHQATYGSTTTEQRRSVSPHPPPEIIEAAWRAYENRWAALERGAPVTETDTLPWPVLGRNDLSSPRDITQEDVDAFLRLSADHLLMRHEPMFRTEAARWARLDLAPVITAMPLAQAEADELLDGQRLVVSHMKNLMKEKGYSSADLADVLHLHGGDSWRLS